MFGVLFTHVLLFPDTSLNQHISSLRSPDALLSSQTYSRSREGVFFGTPGNLGNARGVAFTFLTPTIHFFLLSISSASSPCPCIHSHSHALCTPSSFPPSLLMASFAAAISSAPAGTHSSQQTRISANDRATAASYRPRCILLCPISSALPHTDVTLRRARAPQCRGSVSSCARPRAA
ncbi:unnamed protein product [Chondrus crispus]|uniref:Uncharacterized protein n=1 Tax=Chondrus crispus TaxID=2769 RepID=R7QC66_CHOCR|nr:unnamed protein product [Chondrus crispus]CDF35674.1 unnamed protein product [Chondrus crispus]|eukprot:XP_005715493.1 unnamed protein product [Chondrus crispus]